MSGQPERTGSKDTPSPAIDDLAARYLLSCTIESLQYVTDEIIIVLRVVGEVDLWTVPILQAALNESLDQRPAHLVVDLAQMTFCSARGLDLLTQTGHIAAERATGYAVTGVPPWIHRVWTLCWGSDRPARYRSTAAAVAAIRAADPVPSASLPRSRPGVQVEHPTR